MKQNEAEHLAKAVSQPARRRGSRLLTRSPPGREPPEEALRAVAEASKKAVEAENFIAVTGEAQKARSVQKYANGKNCTNRKFSTLLVKGYVFLL